MKVIDFHTHAFPDAIHARAIESLKKACGGLYTPCHDGSLSGLMGNMDKFGISLSVVAPVITNPRHFDSLNSWAKQISGERIISLGAVHPETESYREDIDKICDLGLPGLKLHPEYQSFYIGDPKMMKIYEYAFSKGLFILFHAGFDPAYPPPVHSSPEAFLKLSEAFPEGRIIAAHLGGQKQWDKVLEVLAGSRVYLDTSMGQKYYPKDLFLKIVEKHGSEKILFGSDSPWSRADEEIESIKKSGLKPQELENIFYKNAERLLKINI